MADMRTGLRCSADVSVMLPLLPLTSASGAKTVLQQHIARGQDAYGTYHTMIGFIFLLHHRRSCV